MKTHALVALRLSTTALVATAAAGLVLSAQLAPGLSGHPADATSPRLEPTAAKNQIDTGDVDAVRAAYLSRWAPATETKVTSGGTAKSCRKAASTNSEQKKTLKAINFARGLVGQNAVTFTSAYNDAASKAAVIMAANGRLSHQPPKSWKCWSQSGAEAAGSSNILLNGSSPTAARLVGLYLDDPGSSNYAAGHRRWLLRPEATKMGSGNAQGDWFGNAIYLFSFKDDNKNAPSRSLYAWPSAGYFPSQLEPDGRWSLSSAGNVSFAKATVKVVGPNGDTVPVTKRSVTNGYADNTLVWDFKSPPAAVSSSSAQTYKVTVSGMTGGSASSYTYQVKLFDPTATTSTGTSGGAGGTGGLLG